MDVTTYLRRERVCERVCDIEPAELLVVEIGRVGHIASMIRGLLAVFIDALQVAIVFWIRLQLQSTAFLGLVLQSSFPGQFVHGVVVLFFGVGLDSVRVVPCELDVRFSFVEVIYAAIDDSEGIHVEIMQAGTRESAIVDELVLPHEVAHESWTVTAAV